MLVRTEWYTTTAWLHSSQFSPRKRPPDQTKPRSFSYPRLGGPHLPTTYTPMPVDSRSSVYVVQHTAVVSDTHVIDNRERSLPSPRR